jgi:YVTN family beta-propeller protein
MLLFSTDTDSGTVTVLSKKNNDLEKVAVIPVGNGPRGGVMFTKDGRGFVGNSAGDTISEIDALSFRESAKIKVGIAPTGVGLIPGDRFALVSNSGSNYVSIVDLNNRSEIGKISTGREPKHMCISSDGKLAFVAVFGADHVSVIDTSALSTAGDTPNLGQVREIARISVGADSAPYSTAISHDDKYVLVANNQVDYMNLIDVETMAVAKTVYVGSKGGRGVGFSASGEIGFISIEDTNELVTISIPNGEILARTETGPGPRGFAIDDEISTIFVAGFSRTRKSLGQLTQPNTVSQIRFGAEKFSALTKTDMEPELSDSAVGAGPCSVSIFRDF